jgi:spore maturation protein CgeB
MKLTFFGSSIVSAYWNGAATYYRGLLRALAELGYEITFCEPDAFDRQANRDLDEDPAYARVIVYDEAHERDRLVDRALDESDWVIKCSGVGKWDRELEERIAIRGGGSPARTAFWDVDAPATLERLREDPSDPFHEHLPRFDRVFTYGGGPPVVEQYEGAGARVCVPIYNGLDPEEHYPEEAAGGYRWDAFFMGNRLPDRESRVDEFFFRVAEACPDHRFALGGNGWDDRPMPANVDYLGHVPTGRHNALNGAARLVLNIHRSSMVENGYSPATRMFEAAGAAACQVTDAWTGIDEFFEPDQEIFVAADATALAGLVHSVSPERAARVGAAARRRALRDHTYGSRAERVDRILRNGGGES